jgi:hypothetical protein
LLEDDLVSFFEAGDDFSDGAVGETDLNSGFVEAFFLMLVGDLVNETSVLTLIPEAIKLLSISEAAAIGCSYRTVLRGIEAGKIAATRRSSRVFVSEHEVAKYAKPAYRPSRHQPDKSRVKTARWHQSQVP